MPDERLISSSRLRASEVVRHSFTTVRRGYDPREVRAFLELVAREMQAHEELVEQYRQEVKEAEERARHPVLDEGTLTSALGQQSAQVLRQAHESAAKIVLEAEQQAATLLREATQQVTETKVSAEAASAERIAEAELQAANLRQHAEHEAHQVLVQARHDGEGVVAKARERGREMIEEAQSARKRVVADLAQRRRAFQLQIEQLRAARDELAAAVVAVRDKADRMAADLQAADAEARQAAVEVKERVEAEGTGAPEPAGGGERGADASEAAPYDADEHHVAVATPEPPPGAEERAGATEAGALAPEPTRPAHAAGPDPAPEPGAEATGSVDNRSLEELFARIRRSQRKAPRPSGESTPSPHVAEASVPAAVEGSEAIDGDGAFGGEHEALSRRDEALGPVTSRLSRAIKRVLQDDQNRLLDALRGRSGRWSEDLLATEAEHRAPFAEAALDPLRRAAEEGRAYVAPNGDGPPPAPLGEDQLAAMAEELAATVVTLLRRRLPGGEEGPPPAEVDDAAEVVGAAYREWRGQRVDSLVGDYTVRAYGLGELRGVGQGGGLRWVPGGDAAPCADCEDNSLAGVVPAGEDFPTGQPCPPAHAGCRCVLVPEA